MSLASFFLIDSCISIFQRRFVSCAFPDFEGFEEMYVRMISLAKEANGKPAQLFYRYTIVIITVILIIVIIT